MKTKRTEIRQTIQHDSCFYMKNLLPVKMSALGAHGDCEKAVIAPHTQFKQILLLAVTSAPSPWHDLQLAWWSSASYGWDTETIWSITKKYWAPPNLFCVNLCAYWWISVPRASTDQELVNTSLETASHPAAQRFIWKTLCWLLTCVLTYNILFHGEIQMQLWF